MASTTNRVSAREKARRAMAEQEAENRRRLELNEKSLQAFFAAADSIDKAAEVRDTQIAKANETFENKTATARAAQAAAVAELQERGEKAQSIAALTDVSVAEIRKLAASAKPAPAKPTKAAAEPKSDAAPSSGAADKDASGQEAKSPAA